MALESTPLLTPEVYLLLFLIVASPEWPYQFSWEEYNNQRQSLVLIRVPTVPILVPTMGLR
jgi:hypothetical protein